MASDIPEDSGARFPPKITKSKAYCSVRGCRSRACDKPDVRFHRFPELNEHFVKLKNEFGEYEKVDCRIMWEKVLKIEKIVTKRMQVCSLHFTKNDYILPGESKNKRFLKKTAIPSCNLPADNVNKRTNQDQNNERPTQRLKIEEVDFHCKSEIEDSIDLDADADPFYQNNEDINESNFNEPEEFSQLEKTSNFGMQVTSTDFVMNYFETIQTDSELNALTGIENLNVLNTLINIVRLGYPEYKLTNMDVRSKIIMTFMKLKHNASYGMLSAFFKYASEFQCRTIIVNMIDKLQNCLKDAVYFPTKKEISRNILLCSRESTNVRVILSCIEVSIQKPAELCCQQATSSHSNTDFSIKFMIGATPGGMVSFVSNAYGGNISDDAIFEQSKIVDLLERGDAILFDESFRSENLCKKENIQFIRPSSKKEDKFPRFPRKNKVSRSSVHIELTSELMKRIKAFKVIGSKMPSSLISHVDKIMVVIAAIINMSLPILQTMESGQL